MNISNVVKLAKYSRLLIEFVDQWSAKHFFIEKCVCLFCLFCSGCCFSGGQVVQHSQISAAPWASLIASMFMYSLLSVHTQQQYTQCHVVFSMYKHRLCSRHQRHQPSELLWRQRFEYVSQSIFLFRVKLFAVWVLDVKRSTLGARHVAINTSQLVCLLPDSIAMMNVL